MADRELDGLDEATFGFAEVAGLRIPIMTSGIIGGGIRNFPTIDGQDPTGEPNDGLQIRTSNRTITRDTDSYVAAFGGEWIDNTLLRCFRMYGWMQCWVRAEDNYP